MSPGQPLPTTYFLLFSAVVMALVSISVFLIKEVTRAQRELSRLISNHFEHDIQALSEISGHMARTNQYLDIVLTKLLRNADEEEEGSTQR